MRLVKNEAVIVHCVDDTVCFDHRFPTREAFLLLAMHGFETCVRNHDDIVFANISPCQLFDFGVGIVIDQDFQLAIRIFLDLGYPLHQSDRGHEDESRVRLGVIRHDE